MKKKIKRKVPLLALRDMPKESCIQAMAQRFPDLEPTALEVYLLLLRIANDIQMIMDSYFHKFDISNGRFSTLILLLKAPEHRLKPSELAEKTGVTRATMTGLMDNLEKKGLIKRVQNSVDLRATEVELTTKGERLLEKMLPQHFARISSLMVGINANDRKSITHAFYKIRSNAEKLRD